MYWHIGRFQARGLVALTSKGGCNELYLVEHGWVPEQSLVMNDSESSREKWVLTPGYRKTGKVPDVIPVQLCSLHAARPWAGHFWSLFSHSNLDSCECCLHNCRHTYVSPYDDVLNCFILYFCTFLPF